MDFFRKYKTFDDVTRRLWRAIIRMDKIDTEKFDELEIDRLCDFKYSLREMKDKYVHIVKEPIPILVMQLIDFQIPQFMNEIKYSDEEGFIKSEGIRAKNDKKMKNTINPL